MREIFFAALVITQISLLITSFVPSIKCRITDGNCIKSAAQAALPTFASGIGDLGVVPLDVMHVDKIDVDLSGLLLNMKNINIYGLKKSIIDNISVDWNKKQIKLKYHTDIVFKGKYKTSGTLLNLPITGDGDIVLTLDYFEVSIVTPFEVAKNANGKDIIELKSFKYKFNVKKNARTELTNLFNGNKVLGDATLKAINENWKVLMQDIGKAILEKPMQICYNAIKTYLHATPLDSITVSS